MVLDALYLFLDIFTLSFPLLQSWDKKLRYFSKWHALFPAIGIIGLFFITWDVLFTKWGIWGFNERYLIDITILHLPLEEWLFFLVVPFACVFIYEATLYYFKSRPFRKLARPLFILTAILLLIVAGFNLDKLYTAVTFSLTGIALISSVLLTKRDFLDRFIMGYLFSLIPFLLVNGILTGSFIENEIVWYKNSENLGIRIGTIPIEDTVYLLLYLLGIVTIYESILKRFPLLGINYD